MSGINIDRDAAHDAAQRELSKPIYPKASLSERFSAWLDELLYKLFVEGTSVPGGWITIAILAAVVIAAAVVAVRVGMRTMRTNRGRDQALFDSHELSAAEHRSVAQQYAAQGNWAAAIRHRLRAVARRLEETSVLDPVPGRTATELARAAGAALPDLASELRSAVDVFNDVTYGGRTATETGYLLIADLDDRLHAVNTVPVATVSPAIGTDWAPLR